MASLISPLPAKKAECWIHTSTKFTAGLRASVEISLGMSVGCSQLNNTCNIAAIRSVCPFDLESIPKLK